MARFAVALVLCLACLAACQVTISTRTFDTDIEGLKAESTYLNVYTAHATRLASANQAFLPSGSNPGVCNKGGSKQGCYDADKRVIDEVGAFLTELAAVPVPARYVNGDRLLRQGLGEMRRGLQLRNDAIAENDNAKWQQHGPALQNATDLLKRANEEFPADNRPPPL